MPVPARRTLAAIFLSFLTVLVASAVLADRASAQESSSLMSFDATVGRSFGRGGGTRENREGVALDALLAWRSRRPGLRGALAFETGVQGKRSSGPPCLPLPGVECTPNYPRMYTLGILFGLEHASKAGVARLMAGPTHFRVDGGGGALGGQARLELVSPPFHRVAAVGSARGGLVWHLDRQNFQLGAVGIGLGIY